MSGCDRDDINSHRHAHARCRDSTRDRGHIPAITIHKRNVKPRTQREKINAIPKTALRRSRRLPSLIAPRARASCILAILVLARPAWDWVETVRIRLCVYVIGSKRTRLTHCRLGDGHTVKSSSSRFQLEPDLPTAQLTPQLGEQRLEAVA